MKCIRCGRNVRTSAEERNFFRGMGYYSPMYWVRDQGLNETICKAEGLDPNDSEHFLCFDCYYDLMEKQRDEYLKNKDFGPIKIKGTFKESKVSKKLNEMGRTVFNYNASTGWSASNKTYAWHYFRNFLEDIGATRTRDDGTKGCSGELKGLSFELNYAFSNKEYNYTIDVFNIAQGTIQDQWQGKTLGEFKEDFQEMKDIYTSSEAGIYPEETLTESVKLKEATDPATIIGLVAYIGVMGAALVGLGKATYGLMKSSLDKVEETDGIDSTGKSLKEIAKEFMDKFRNKTAPDEFGLTPEELDVLDVTIHSVVASEYTGVVTEESLTWAVLSKLKKEQPEIFHKLTHKDGLDPWAKDTFNYVLNKTTADQYDTLESYPDDVRLKLHNRRYNKVLRNQLNQKLKADYGIKGLSNGQYNTTISKNFTEARQYQGNEKIKFTTYLKYLKKEEHLTDDIIETFKQYLADEQNFYEEDYDEKRTVLEWDDFLTLFENTGWDDDEE